MTVSTKQRGTYPYTRREGLAVYRFGEGNPVLLMPGPHRFQQPADGSAAPLIHGLSRLGRRVISFDLPGAGNSTRPAHLSMPEMHDCADEALEVCGVSGPVDTVGHSMAGLAALAYAIERPERVGRLVLIGTGGKVYMKAPGALWNHGHPAFWRMAALAILHIVWPRGFPVRERPGSSAAATIPSSKNRRRSGLRSDGFCPGSSAGSRFRSLHEGAAMMDTSTRCRILGKPRGSWPVRWPRGVGESQVGIQEAAQ